MKSENEKDVYIDEEGNKWLLFRGQWIPIIPPEDLVTKFFTPDTIKTLH